MGLMPEKFSYTALVEYLIKRQLTFIHSADSDNEESLTITGLPVPQNHWENVTTFFKSGHVSEVKSNEIEAVVHVNAEVMSSYKSRSYRKDIVLKKTSGEVLTAKCKYVAGQGGKCNHVADVLLGLLVFQQTADSGTLHIKRAEVASAVPKVKDDQTL